MKTRRGFIKIPVLFITDELSTTTTITTTPAGEKLTGNPIIASGETQTEAIKQFKLLLEVNTAYYKRQDQKLTNRTIIIGDWKRPGGRWFSVFGIGLYFRKGKQNKGGKFIPFTDINLSLINHRKNKQWK